MHGNIWEWCSDWFDVSGLPGGRVIDPQGPSSGAARLIRGGGWHGYAIYCRASCRDDYYPGGRYGGIGFRVVLAPGQ